MKRSIVLFLAVLATFTSISYGTEPGKDKISKISDKECKLQRNSYINTLENYYKTKDKFYLTILDYTRSIIKECSGPNLNDLYTKDPSLSNVFIQMDAGLSNKCSALQYSYDNQWTKYYNSKNKFNLENLSLVGAKVEQCKKNNPDAIFVKSNLSSQELNDLLLRNGSTEELKMIKNISNAISVLKEEENASWISIKEFYVPTINKIHKYMLTARTVYRDYYKNGHSSKDYDLAICSGQVVEYFRRSIQERMLVILKPYSYVTVASRVRFAGVMLYGSQYEHNYNAVRRIGLGLYKTRSCIQNVISKR